jgi:hypothetical protein
MSCIYFTLKKGNCMLLACGQLRRKVGSRDNPVNIASMLWPGRQENSGSNTDNSSDIFPSNSLNGPVMGPTDIRIQLVKGQPSTELQLSFIPRDWPLISVECRRYKYVDLYVLAPIRPHGAVLNSPYELCFVSLCLASLDLPCFTFINFLNNRFG